MSNARRHRRASSRAAYRRQREQAALGLRRLSTEPARWGSVDALPEHDIDSKGYKAFVVVNERDGLYLMGYDPHWVPPPPAPSYPSGLADWTDDLNKALVFSSAVEAWELWRTQSQTVPTRPDGRPNRPLTALNIVVYPLAVTDEPPPE